MLLFLIHVFSLSHFAASFFLCLVPRGCLENLENTENEAEEKVFQPPNVELEIRDYTRVVAFLCSRE